MVPPAPLNMREYSHMSMDSCGNYDDQSGGDAGGIRTPPSQYYIGSQEVAHLPKSTSTLLNLKRREALTASSSRLCIVLVGLPGRGKSFIARKLDSFLNWRGCRCKVFNVGKYRREVVGKGDANFFKGDNSTGNNLREMVAQRAMEDMFQWLEEPLQRLEEGLSPKVGAEGGGGGGKDIVDSVAVFDATNSTKARRNWIMRECAGRKHPVGVVFVESLCDDVGLLEDNFRLKVRNSPDFEGMDEEAAMADLKARVANYEAVYETVDDDNCSYIKVFNLSAKIMANQIFGRMSKVIIPCLMAWNIGTRPIWLCRAGETEEDRGRGTDGKRARSQARLSDRGRAFRDKLAAFVKERGGEWVQNRDKEMYQPTLGDEGGVDGGHAWTGVRLNSGVAVGAGGEGTRGGGGNTDVPCKIMSSTMPRAYETAYFVDGTYRVEQFSNLNPLDKGDFSGLELEDIASEDEEWYEELQKNPFGTRFPGGESYRDLVQRLESCLIDMEQQVAPVLVVSHVSVLQCLVAYFRNMPVEDCTGIAFPMDTVVEMIPVKGGGWKESRFQLMPRSRMNSRELAGEDAAAMAAGGEGGTSSDTAGADDEMFVEINEFQNQDNAKSTSDDKSQLPIWGDKKPNI